jgi:hypothetical protein
MRLIGPLAALISRVMSPFVGLVSQLPARVQTKLLAAFLATTFLLITVGAVASTTSMRLLMTASPAARPWSEAHC